MKIRRNLYFFIILAISACKPLGLPRLWSESDVGVKKDLELRSVNGQTKACIGKDLTLIEDNEELYDPKDLQIKDLNFEVVAIAPGYFHPMVTIDLGQKLNGRADLYVFKICPIGLVSDNSRCEEFFSDQPVLRIPARLKMNQSYRISGEACLETKSVVMTTKREKSLRYENKDVFCSEVKERTFDFNYERKHQKIVDRLIQLDRMDLKSRKIKQSMYGLMQEDAASKLVKVSKTLEETAHLKEAVKMLMGIQKVSEGAFLRSVDENLEESLIQVAAAQRIKKKDQGLNLDGKKLEDGCVWVPSEEEYAEAVAFVLSEVKERKKLEHNADDFSLNELDFEDSESPADKSLIVYGIAGGALIVIQLVTMIHKIKALKHIEAVENDVSAKILGTGQTQTSDRVSESSTARSTDFSNSARSRAQTLSGNVEVGDEYNKITKKMLKFDIKVSIVLIGAAVLGVLGAAVGYFLTDEAQIEKKMMGYVQNYLTLKEHRLKEWSRIQELSQANP